MIEQLGIVYLYRIMKKMLIEIGIVSQMLATFAT